MEQTNYTKRQNKKKQIKEILQECYNVDLAADRGREYVADMLTSRISGDEENDLYVKNYYFMRSKLYI